MDWLKKGNCDADLVLRLTDVYQTTFHQAVLVSDGTTLPRSSHGERENVRRPVTEHRLLGTEAHRRSNLYLNDQRKQLERKVSPTK